MSAKPIPSGMPTHQTVVRVVYLVQVTSRDSYGLLKHDKPEGYDVQNESGEFQLFISVGMVPALDVVMQDHKKAYMPASLVEEDGKHWLALNPAWLLEDLDW